MKRILSIVLATLIVAVTLNAIHATNNNNYFIRLKSIELKNTQKELDNLEKSYEELHNNSKSTEEYLKKLEQEKQRLEAELQAKVQIKSNQAKVYAATDGSWHTDCRPQAAAVKESVFRLGLGADWEYIEYIFSRESCLDPGRINNIGCAGLGQRCAGSILRNVCGANDIDCQVKHFNDYAQRAHGGGWYNCYKWWQANHWW